MSALKWKITVIKIGKYQICKDWIKKMGFKTFSHFDF